MKNEYRKIFKTSELRELDEYTIENEPITSLNLMERAASLLTQKLLIFFSRGHIFNILAGSGNNAGDGYVVARLLNEKGLITKVFDLCPGKRLSPDCAVNRERFVRNGGVCIEVEKAEDFLPDENSVIIDAIFGAGLNRPVTGFFGDVIRKVNELPNTVVAIDIPSGLLNWHSCSRRTESMSGK